MIGAVVSLVESSGGPIEAKLILGSTEAHPVKAHMHQFGLARNDGVVGDTGDGGIIGL